MHLWKCSPYSLALFHVERSFPLEAISELGPWIERAQHVRQMVYLNATDPQRKDQWLWMQRYEKMLTDHLGEKFTFLPNEGQHDRKREPQAAEPASTVPLYDEPYETPPGR